MSNAGRGKGIVSITVWYPFPVWLGYIWVYIVLGLVLENANVKSRMGMNVELRFKRVRSRRRKNSIRMYRSGNADGLCERMDSHRYRGFVAWWTSMESMTLLVIGIERTCHLDIATPLSPPECPLIMPYVKRYRSMAHLNRSFQERHES